MSFDLPDTTASQISSALVKARRNAGSPAMGMVLTLVVVTDEAMHYDAMKTATAVSSEHPSRVLGVIRRSARGAPRLDAQVTIGDNAPGEAVLLRMSGELTRHAESVVLPLLLPDSPVVIWWPGTAPEDPSDDPLGRLANRRLTDAAGAKGSRTTALRKAGEAYAPGDTDLAWTRLTPWRALLAAALDQVDVRVHGGMVSAERGNPSAELMVAWLEIRLGVPFERKPSRGPGLTEVRLNTTRGDIAISRHGGITGTFTIPGEADRAVALKRREPAELLAEDLRRLDEDEIYAQAIGRLLRRNAKQTGAKAAPTRTTAKKAPAKKAASKKTASGPAATKSAARKSTPTKKSASKKSAAKKSSTRKAGS